MGDPFKSTKRLPGMAFTHELQERLPFLQKIPTWGWSLLGLGLFCGFLILGTASLPESSVSAPGMASLNSITFTVNVIFKFGIVLALIYAAFYFLRRWRGGLPGVPSRRMAVIETARLSPRQAIHLVRVGNQELLIGATDQNLSLLAEIEPATAIAAQSDSMDATHPVLTYPNTPLTFASLFSSDLKGRK
jgi:flagellar biosynthetic protein FliO